MKKIMSLLLAFMLVVSCVPMHAFAAVDTSEYTAPTVVVESKAAAAGSTVQVNLLMVNNPGIAGAKITISYDEKLTLVDAISGESFDALDYMRPGVYANPCNFTWDSENAEVDADGVLLTLVFQISEDAQSNENLRVNVSYKYGYMYDTDLNSIAFDMVSGYVNVINYIPGDVNGDGDVGGKDVTLIRRYNVGGYDITINEAAADVNDDGDISGKDVTLVRRYNAGGYDVVLLPSTPKCVHEMQETAAKSPTCTEDGNCAYWQCTKCNKYFIDGREVDFEDTKIAAAGGHTQVTAVPEKTPQVGVAGNTAYWHCATCGKYYSDAACKNEIALGDTVIPGLAVPTYTVTFKDHDGTVLKTETVESGKGATAPADPTREGYAFTGWDKAFNNITTDLVVVAQYEQLSTEPELVLSKVTAHAGDEIVVTVSVRNNPGILGAIFSIGYDPTVMTLKSAENLVTASEVNYQPPAKYKNPTIFMWDAQDLTWTEDGAILKLVFSISATAANGDYAVTLTYDSRDMYDGNFAPINFAVTNAVIQIR